MKLEPKELIPYLPYELGLWDFYENRKTYFTGFVGNHTEPINTGTRNYMSVGRTFKEIKPILRPLSDLTKEIEHDGNLYLGLDEFSDREWSLYNESGKEIIQVLQYDCIIELIKIHFDVFGLIEKGLAIDINTL